MYGNRVHAAVLAAGVKETGATVHFVTDRYDEGDVIAQIVTPVKVGDTAESLAARVFSAECQLYPQVLNKLVVGAWPQPNGLVERFFYNADS